jgi:hypothetical protein
VTPRRSVWFVAAAAFTHLTVVFTWPLGERLSSALPHDLGDPILNTWLLWWNAHVAPLTRAWWNPPFFWPLPDVLARSENLLGISLVATPLQWLGATPVVAYNIVFLLSFPLTAMAAYALAYVITRQHAAAAIAGLVFAFNPYRTSQFAHLQMMWAFWMPLALATLHRYREDGRWQWLVAFDLLWIGQALSNGYYLLFFSILVVLWIAWFLSSRHDVRRLLPLAVAWAAAWTVVAPLLVGYQTALNTAGAERTLTEIRAFSADLSAFAATSPLVWTWRRLSLVFRSEQQLFPGVFAVALTIAGLWSVPGDGRSSPLVRRVRIGVLLLAGAVVGLAAIAMMTGPIRTRVLTVDSIAKPIGIAIWLIVAAVALGPRVRRAFAERSSLVFYAGAALLMFACALGPEPALHGQAIWYKPPYAWLINLPGFGAIRVPARFAMLGELCLAIAAASSFAAYVRSLRPRQATVAAAVCIAALLADSWVAGLPVPSVPERFAGLEAIDNGTPVLELPLGVLEDTAAMYRSMFHRAPLVNGYSGFVPPHYALLQTALAEGDDTAIDALLAVHDLVVVIDRAREPGLAARVARHPGAKWTGSESGREFFAVHLNAAEDSPRSDVGVRTVTPVPSTILRSLTDGDLRTRWDSGTAQRGDESIAVELGADAPVTAVELAMGPYTAEFPRHVAVDVSSDGSRWTTVWDDLTGRLAVLGAARDPRRVPLWFRFPPQRARFVRVRQLGSHPSSHWAIAELRVFAVD